MNSRLSLLALGVGAYLAFAIASFPASIAYRWFAPDELALASIEGTVWRGSAAYGGFGGISFSSLQWQLHPAALVTGAVSVTAETNIAGGLARADIRARGSRLTLSEVRASVNLASLPGLLPFRGVTGNLTAMLDRFELDDGWPVGAAGTIRLAGLAGPPVFPVPGVSTLQVGNYLVRFAPGNATAVVAAIVDEGGPLELSGQIVLNPDRSYRLEALIKPRAQADDVLIQGLQILAPPNASGQHSFQYEDRL